MAAAAVGIAASTAVSALLYHPDADPARVYYGTDTRAGALLAGCALAAVLGPGRRYPRRLLPVVAAAATAVLAAAWATADGTDRWLYRGGLTLLAMAAAAVLAHLVTAPVAVAARVLSSAPLVGLGRISYGVYLWHWPLYQQVNADRSGLQGTALFSTRLAVTLAAATAGYHLVEKPARRLRPRWRTLGPVLAATAAVTAAAMVLATATSPPPRPPPLATGGHPCPADHDRVPVRYRTRRAAGPPTRNARTGGLLRRLRRLELRRLPARDARAAGHRPGHQGLRHHPIRYRPLLRRRAPQQLRGLGRHLAQRGRHRRSRPGGHPARSPGSSRPPGRRPVAARRRTRLRRAAVRRLGYALDIVTSRGARPVLLTTPYSHKDERPDGGLWPEDTPQRADACNRILTMVAADHPSHPIVLDLNRVACPQGRFTWSVRGIQLRSDGLHFTPAGVCDIIAPG